MKKYYLNDGTGGKTGPFDAEELKTTGVTPETAIWVEGDTDWTTVGSIDELKSLFTPVPLPLPTEDPLPTATDKKVDVEPVAASTIASTPAGETKVAPAPKAAAPKDAKKSTAWVSWLLTLLVLGGAGFFIYQNMQESKTAGSSTVATTDNSDTASATTSTSTTTDATDSPDTIAVSTTTTDVPATTTTTDAVNPTTTTKKDDPKATAKKAEDEKKKKLAEAAKKAEEDKKKKQEAAAAAAAARELEQRNRWPNYISFGKLNYDTKGDGIDPFDVPIYNGTDYMLDKVTVRIEYTKKDKKIVKTENITINNIPPRTTLNGKAPESKKGDKVNIFITSITSRQMHFCYPQNNGNASDPYFCN